MRIWFGGLLGGGAPAAPVVYQQSVQDPLQAERDAANAQALADQQAATKRNGARASLLTDPSAAGDFANQTTARKTLLGA